MTTPMMVDLWGPPAPKVPRVDKPLEALGAPRLRYVFLGFLLVYLGLFATRLLGGAALAIQHPELLDNQMVFAAELANWTQSNGAGVLIGRITQACALLGAVLIAARNYPGGWRAMVSWEVHWKVDLRLAALAAIGMRLLWLFITRTMELIGIDLPQVSSAASIMAGGPEWLWALAWASITFNPIAQELFFRGLALPALSRKVGLFGGVVLSSLAYSLLYLQSSIGGTLFLGGMTFVVGVIAAGLTLHTRRVSAAVMFHVVFNATGALLVLNSLWLNR